MLVPLTRPRRWAESAASGAHRRGAGCRRVVREGGGTRLLYSCMTRRIIATITVAGDAALLAAYRKRVNELLDVDFGEPYRELHAPGRLDYRLKADGVPYPPFVTASGEFPDLVVEVRWEYPDGATSGRATIQAGRLTQQSTAAGPGAVAASCELRVDTDGTLVIAVACRRRTKAEWIGYALTASQHAMFRVERRGAAEVLTATDGVEPEWAERWTIAGDGVRYAELDPRDPVDERLLGELDRLANDFADEWLWFADGAPDETAVERQRYERYGWKVNPANVRTEKLKTVLRETPSGGFELAMADPEAAAIAALVARHWLQTARH